MQCAGAILTFVASPVLQYLLPKHLINGGIFKNKNKIIVHKMFFDFSTSFSKTFFILWKNERDMIVNVYWCLCKVLVILVRLQWNSNFLERFSKNEYQISWKSIQLEQSCSIRTDRQAEMANLKVPFRNCPKAPKYQESDVVCFLLGDSPASEFYKPTFRNTPSVPSS
jgi:hypothetical protein